MLTGTVTEFSDASGLGTVTVDDGRSFPFHVIEIADGTRTIEVGRRVRFTVMPKLGRYEAGRLDKV